MSENLGLLGVDGSYCDTALIFSGLAYHLCSWDITGLCGWFTSVISVSQLSVLQTQQNQSNVKEKKMFFCGGMEFVDLKCFQS